MDDLTYGLRKLCRRHRREGTPTSRADRLRILALASRQLREAGFRQMRLTSLKNKHIKVLVQRWCADGLSVSTIRKRTRYLRWWAKQIGKANAFPTLNSGAIDGIGVSRSNPRFGDRKRDAVPLAAAESILTASDQEVMSRG